MFLYLETAQRDKTSQELPQMPFHGMDEETAYTQLHKMRTRMDIFQVGTYQMPQVRNMPVEGGPCQILLREMPPQMDIKKRPSSKTLSQLPFGELECT